MSNLCDFFNCGENTTRNYASNIVAPNYLYVSYEGISPVGRFPYSSCNYFDTLAKKWYIPVTHTSTSSYHYRYSSSHLIIDINSNSYYLTGFYTNDLTTNTSTSAFYGPLGNHIGAVWYLSNVNGYNYDSISIDLADVTGSAGYAYKKLNDSSSYGYSTSLRTITIRDDNGDYYKYDPDSNSWVSISSSEYTTDKTYFNKQLYGDGSTVNLYSRIPLNHIYKNKVGLDNSIISIKLTYRVEDIVYEDLFTRDASAYNNNFLFCPYGFAIASHYNYRNGDTYYFNGSIGVIIDQSPMFNNVM